MECHSDVLSADNIVDLENVSTGLPKDQDKTLTTAPPGRESVLVLRSSMLVSSVARKIPMPLCHLVHTILDKNIRD